MNVLLTFSLNHLEFRKAEWDALLDLTDANLPSISANSKEPLETIKVDDLQKLDFFFERSLLLKHAHEVLGEGNSHESVEKQLAASRNQLLSRLDEKKSWRIKYRSHNKKKDAQYIETIIQKYIDVLALDHMHVDMSEPHYDFNVIEDFSSSPSRIYIGLLIGDGQGRLKHQFSLKTRTYIGNSTMDPELSFIQANISRVERGDLVLDSFCGTGGLILAAAKFGAVVLGSEISYMIARAKGSSARMGEGELREDQNVRANFIQQDLDHMFAGLVLADASQHKLWSRMELFDAIVADPPYGVREKGRKLGKKEEKEGWLKNDNTHGVRYPEKTNYRTTALYLDLMDFAASYLVIGGHVSFWYPVLRESYGEEVIPQHMSLELVSNCEQVLSKKGSRRLLCYRKVRNPLEDEVATVKRDPFEETSYREAIFGPAQ